MKINPGIFLSIVIMGALTVFIVGCVNKPMFSGSKTGNDNQFLADFDLLNTTINGKMPLLAGDTVAAEIDIKKGDVDIIVVNENGTIAYQGNNVQTCNFVLTIKDPGTYSFSITGFKAKGSVHFKKVDKTN